MCGQHKSKLLTNFAHCGTDEKFQCMLRRVDCGCGKPWHRHISLSLSRETSWGSCSTFRWLCVTCTRCRSYRSQTPVRWWHRRVAGHDRSLSSCTAQLVKCHLIYSRLFTARTSVSWDQWQRKYTRNDGEYFFSKHSLDKLHFNA